jgi:hypothetical protein
MLEVSVAWRSAPAARSNRHALGGPFRYSIATRASQLPPPHVFAHELSGLRIVRFTASRLQHSVRLQGCAHGRFARP